MQQQIPLTSQQQQQQQELERIAQAETPPAVSNVELASTMIASLIGEQVLLVALEYVHASIVTLLQRTSSPSPQNYSVGVPHSTAAMMQQRLANIKRDTEDSLEGRSNGDDAEMELQRQQYTQKGVQKAFVSIVSSLQHEGKISLHARKTCRSWAELIGFPPKLQTRRIVSNV